MESVAAGGQESDEQDQLGLIGGPAKPLMSYPHTFSLTFPIWQTGCGDQAVATFELLQEVVKHCFGSSGGEMASPRLHDDHYWNHGLAGISLPPASSFLLFTGQMGKQADSSRTSHLEPDSPVGPPLI